MTDTDYQRDRDAILREVREEVGWPEDPANYEEFTAELMWRYIEKLENTLYAERWVRRLEAPVRRPPWPFGPDQPRNDWSKR